MKIAVAGTACETVEKWEAAVLLKSCQNVVAADADPKIFNPFIHTILKEEHLEQMAADSTNWIRSDIGLEPKKTEPEDMLESADRLSSGE